MPPGRADKKGVAPLSAQKIGKVTPMTEDASVPPEKIHETRKWLSKYYFFCSMLGIPNRDLQEAGKPHGHP